MSGYGRHILVQARARSSREAGAHVRVAAVRMIESLGFRSVVRAEDIEVARGLWDEELARLETEDSEDSEDRDTEDTEDTDAEDTHEPDDTDARVWRPSVYSIRLEVSRSAEWVGVLAAEVHHWWVSVSGYAQRLSRHTQCPVLAIEYGDEGLGLQVFVGGQDRARWCTKGDDARLDPSIPHVEWRSAEPLVQVLGERHRQAIEVLTAPRKRGSFLAGAEVLDALQAEFDPPEEDSAGRADVLAPENPGASADSEDSFGVQLEALTHVVGASRQLALRGGPFTDRALDDLLGVGEGASPLEIVQRARGRRRQTPHTETGTLWFVEATRSKS